MEPINRSQRGIEFKFAVGASTAGTMKWPLIQDELTLTRKLHSLSKNWTITVFESANPSISTRFASDVDAKVFSYEELMQEEK